MVREVAAADTSRWVVTFDNYGIGDGFDRLGFAETFLRRQRISALHVLGRGRDWYQYPDVFEACRAARATLPTQARVMAYGSSMGGYAALRFARALRAEAILAMSPQYSIDPAVVPWEERWRQDGARIAWRPELAGPIDPGAPPLLVYDPTGPDRRHAELIRAEAPSDVFPIRYGGHPVTTVLKDLGLLRPLVLGTLMGTLDLAELRRQVRASRGRSPNWLGEVSARQPASRPLLAVALARRAHAVRPHDPGTLLPLARALNRIDERAEALSVCRTILAAGRREVDVLLAYGEALVATGEYAGAVAVAEEVAARRSDHAHFRHWAAAVHAGAGDWTRAIAEQRAAVALAPGIRGFSEALAAYLGQAPRPRGALRLWLGGG